MHHEDFGEKKSNATSSLLGSFNYERAKGERVRGNRVVGETQSSPRTER